MRRRSPRTVLVTVAAASVALAAVLALAVTRTGPFAHHSDPPTAGTGPAAPERGGIDAAGFLERYVSADGRVVRRDQGGDTVSEGQAYAMLIAVVAHDEATFAKVWHWTSTRLLRSDGLLGWRWQDGRLQDESSAADADLDAARALVVAGRSFDRPAWTTRGVALGKAVLDHETATTSQGRVLTAGSWANRTPYAFNPSYVSPAATRVLAAASRDPRWGELARGSRAALSAVSPADHLPPDWAQVTEDGGVQPMPGPSGAPVVFGYDAARALVRNAESCTRADRALVGRMAEQLEGPRTKAVYDLGGSPQTDAASPLTLVAAASGAAVDGDRAQARDLLGDADRARAEAPTYYGDAWSVLGRALLTDRDLGGCPPLARGAA